MLDPWITTCPHCGTSSHYPSEAVSLADQVAPAVNAEPTWIDVPLSADEPARVALFRHFLHERDFPFEESRRFISIRIEDADAIARAIRPWGFEHDMPEDPRVLDSLAHTMQGVSATVLETIEAQRSSVSRHRSIDSSGNDRSDDPRIDLR